MTLSILLRWLGIRHADRSRERYRRIAVSGASSLVASFGIAILNLATVALCISYLGKDQFGLVMVVISLVGWLQLLDFGSIGLVNALSESNGKDDIETSVSHINSAIVLNCMVAAAVGPAVIGLALHMPWNTLLNMRNQAGSESTQVCMLIAWSLFFLNMPVALVGRIFSAFQYGYINHLTQLLASTISFFSIWTAVSYSLSISVVVFFLSATPLMSGLAGMLLVPKYFPWYSFKLFPVSKSSLLRIAHTSMPLFAFQLSALAINQLVVVLLAHIGSLAEVADYTVLLRIYMVVFMVGACCASPFFPAIREAFERKEREWVAAAIKRAVMLRLLAVSLPSLALLFIGNWMILAWVKKPLESPFTAIGWLSLIICMLMSSVSSTLSDIMTHLDEIAPQLKVVSLAAVVVLCGTALLVPQIGLAGVFISMSLSSAFPIFWLMKRVKDKLGQM